MASPEMLDSGKRSNFSQTCSLLSQYLKENKASFGELGLVLSDHKGIPTRTMDLLPMIEKSAQNDFSIDFLRSVSGNFPVGKSAVGNSVVQHSVQYYIVQHYQLQYS